MSMKYWTQVRRQAMSDQNMINEEIEKAVLFYMIFDHAECDVTEEDFAMAKHKQIIKAINSLKAKREEISMLTITSEIVNDKKRVDVLSYLSTLGDYIFETSFEKAFELLKKYTKKRQIYNLSRKIMNDVKESESIDVLIEKSIASFKEVENQTRKDESFMTQMFNALKKIEEQINKEPDISYYTGIFDLDKLTDGLHPGELTVVGARPGVGKTTFALQIAENIARKKRKVAYVSLEMSDTQLINKILARNTRLNSRQLRNGNLEQNDIDKISIAIGELSELEFTILTNTYTIQQIEIESRRLKNQDKLDLLVIDYLQLVKNVGNFRSREQEVSDISRTLKMMSLELNIPIIALCQLNRNASRSEPTLADIRESGAIEQDADNVIFLYSRNPATNVVTVDLQKQRSGNIGIVEVLFNKKNSEFLNMVRK